MASVKGFVCYDSAYKSTWYVGADGGLYRASFGTVEDCHSGFLHGRWEGPAWQVTERVTELRKFADDAMRAQIDAYLGATGVEFQTSFAA